MKAWKKLTALLLAAAMALLPLAGCGKEKETDAPVSITVINRSGEPVTGLYITPVTQDEWGENYAEEALWDGDSLEAGLGWFLPDDIIDGFNILVYDAEDIPLYADAEEAAYALADGDYLVLLPPEGDAPFEITADYDPARYDREEEPFVEEFDLSEFTGCWKYDEEPLYCIIDGESYTWTAVDLYNAQEGPGTVAAEEGAVSLYGPDGEYRTTLTLQDDGTLTDSAGASLYRFAWDQPMLLPTAADALTETAQFPDDFSGVTIGYPAAMECHAMDNMTNALSFNAIMESGTDDYWTNILIGFMPIDGYDPYMTQGLSVAKPYMEHMLGAFLESMYSGKLLKTIATDCRDCGDYYSILGYVWMDGSAFLTDAGQPVRGVMEVRYYGPLGYALVAMTLAVESRVQNYFEICSNMLDSLSSFSDWTTAPKPVPSQPQGSDPGDYGTAYYWYDEDGDIWYWNGQENEFIGFGDSGYIDDDGQYYEANDAGWDYGDYGWGDYIDGYDPWSDPGDTGW